MIFDFFSRDLDEIADEELLGFQYEVEEKLLVEEAKLSCKLIMFVIRKSMACFRLVKNNGRFVGHHFFVLWLASRLYEKVFVSDSDSFFVSGYFLQERFGFNPNAF